MEIFVDVQEYKVSNHGKVMGKHGRILKNQINTGGYEHVSIDGTTKMVHRLVALAFIPNPNNLPQVNHIDGNKRNNHVSNLEWCDHSHNQREAFRIGLNTRDTQKQIVQQLDMLSGEVINTFSSMSDAVRLLFDSPEQKKVVQMVTAISNVTNGRRKSAYGYKWRKLNA